MRYTLAMATWEYLELTWSSGSDSYWVNRTKHSKTTSSRLNEVLDGFGRDGWELVAIDGSTHIFKRPT
jgi:hypothetical protein